jgi:uncharacterized protein (DUF1810 family)
MMATIDADGFDLDRFVSSQETTYVRLLTELRRGFKTSHWIWFIFPQVAGLGSREMSHRYAIGSTDEAQANHYRPVPERRRHCGCRSDVITSTSGVTGPVKGEQPGYSAVELRPGRSR